MASTGARGILCVVLLLVAIVQHTHSARLLQQEAAGVGVDVMPSENRLVPGGPDPIHHYDVTAGVGGDVMPSEDRLVPGGPDPIHHYDAAAGVGGDVMPSEDGLVPGGANPIHH
ncbi:unnamed protein product [Urochloa humidicola]